VAVSVSADLATKVISMLHYYYINLWSIAANFLLVPMMSVAAVLGLAVIVSGFFCIGLASAIALPLLLLLRIVEVWCKFFVSLPLSYIVTGRPQLWALVAMAVLCLAVYRLAVQRRFRLTSAVTALAVYTIVIAVNKYTLRLAPTSVNFLDVGQGDCAVGIGKDYCFVVDGGGLASDSTKSGKGKRVLLPYLLYNGIDGVNAVFISHSDNDHAGGISEIIGGVDIGAIYVSEDCEKNSLYYDILDKADSNGVSVLEMAKGDVLKLSKVNDDCMECIYSGESKDIKSNDNSLVTRYKCEYGSVLFTGDIEAETELDICENNDVSADILKLAHHGSKTSSTEEFLKAVNPLAAVISAKKSVYGHPSEEVTDRLAELKIPYFVTESSGEVSFSFDKDGIKESSYKEDR
jgi:competence protein ComEC